ncbi:uncharacterized protein LOC130782300 isoform X3 [Actinidia eriantha]|uniref:uncharacterized protein LOC130782300 isoform X3 n=1 Tax=Actinidia eriantha TaxID=165200 RepID=UPI00258CE142|nr:uncharacterized protein LOC130782300 isoform X3 [Actinidia eriantha]
MPRGTSCPPDSTPDTPLLSLSAFDLLVILIALAFSVFSFDSGSVLSLSRLNQERMGTRASSSDSHSTIGIEFEAAETLAGLAHSSMRDTESEEQSHRVNKESPSREPVPSEDQEETGQQQYGKVCCVMMGRMKFEQDVELHKPSSICTTSYASFRCSKSRQNLTEVEKEARRIQRVLVNRESARQTIRRRKALYEELTRKVAKLTEENENLEAGDGRERVRHIEENK